jgi:DNA-binding transcriptional regulator YiaG
MPAAQHKLLAWSDERAAALEAWLKRGAELGVSFAAPNGQHSDAAAVGEALKRATACRCEEHTAEAIELDAAAERPAPLAGANPLRAMREAAGLSWSQAAARCGVWKRTWQTWEQKAAAPAELVERVRKTFAQCSRSG